MGLVLAITLVLALLEFRASQGNVGAVWNGVGAVHGTITKTGPAPSRYRVLVPWLLRFVSRRHKLAAYLVLKLLLIWMSMMAASAIMGTASLVFLALFITLTFEYDYWDCYAEVLGVCLILTGEPGHVLIGATIWGLSKETAPLAVPLAFFVGGLPATLAASLAAPLVFSLVIAVQGKAKLYSQRWGLRKMRIQAWKNTEHRLPVYLLGLIAFSIVGPYNPGDLKLVTVRKDIGPLISVGWTLLAVALAFMVRGTALASTYWVGLAWVVAGWAIARARETRVMLPSAIWMAMALVNYA